MTAYIESAKQVGRLENAIGWYHSHPGTVQLQSYSTVQYSTVQYSTVQYSTVQYRRNLKGKKGERRKSKGKKKDKENHKPFLGLCEVPHKRAKTV